MSNYPLQWWLYTITRGPLHFGLLSGDLASFDLANGCFINVSFGSRNFVCLITFSLFFPLAGWAMMLNDKHLCLALFWSSFSFRDLRFHLLVLTLFALYHEVLISFALYRLIFIFLQKRQNRYEYKLLRKKWNDFICILFLWRHPGPNFNLIEKKVNYSQTNICLTFVS